MLGQSFELSDLPVILSLIGLEGLLSADNAMVLAIMVRHLPKDQRNKALTYGLVGAFVFRFIAILAAAHIIKLWGAQMVGGAYLLFVMIKHFFGKAGADKDVTRNLGFWKTVILVEFTDIAFAVDSVVVAVTVVSGREDKIWVVYTGAIIGVVLLRFAASLFVRLLEKFPRLDHMAYALVGWAGVKLVMMSLHHAVQSWDASHPLNPAGIHVPEMPHVVFWGVMMGIAIVGVLYATRDRQRLREEDQGEPISRRPE